MLDYFFTWKSEAIRRMAALNKEIASVEDLNANYQIGASYFLKLMCPILIKGSIEEAKKEA